MKNGNKVRVIGGICQIQKDNIGKIGTVIGHTDGYPIIKFEEGYSLFFQ
jgi:hypothetical protein